MNHLTLTQLQEFLDNLPTETANAAIGLHLRTCEECSRKLHSLQQFGVIMQKIPLERVSKGFTQQVMNKLKIERSSSFVWNIFENLAPVVAFTLIIGIVYAVFQLTGTFQGSDIQQSVSYTQSVYTKVGGSISEGLSGFNEWVQKYFSFAFAKNNYGMTTFLIVFFGAVALLDKLLLMPKTRKRW